MNIKTLSLSALAVGIILMTPAMSLAETFGYIDYKKVIDNCSQAKNALAQAKVNEADLQQFLAKSQKQLKSTKKTEQKALQEKYAKEFQTKKLTYSKDFAQKWKAVNTKIDNAIKECARKKSVDVVLSKGTIFYGGIDLTQDVITKIK